MSNQSFVQIPTDLTDEVNLRRLLTRMVEQIDTILGNRAESPFVLESEQADDAQDLLTIAEEVDSLSETVIEQGKDIDSLEDDVDTLQTNFDTVQYTITHQALGTVYHDFNDAAWASLQGHGQFNANGSAISNAPYTLTGASNYNVFAHSITTTGGGIVQRVVIEDVTAGSIRIFYRAGDTFATAQSNGWKEV